jgi:hypothetical protein
MCAADQRRGLTRRHLIERKPFRRGRRVFRIVRSHNEPTLPPLEIDFEGRSLKRVMRLLPALVCLVSAVSFAQYNSLAGQNAPAAAEPKRVDRLGGRHAPGGALRPPSPSPGCLLAPLRRPVVSQAQCGGPGGPRCRADDDGAPAVVALLCPPQGP